MLSKTSVLLERHSSRRLYFVVILQAFSCIWSWLKYSLLVLNMIVKGYGHPDLVFVTFT